MWKNKRQGQQLSSASGLLPKQEQQRNHSIKLDKSRQFLLRKHPRNPWSKTAMISVCETQSSYGNHETSKRCTLGSCKGLSNS